MYHLCRLLSEPMMITDADMRHSASFYELSNSNATVTQCSWMYILTEDKCLNAKYANIHIKYYCKMAKYRWFMFSQWPVQHMMTSSNGNIFRVTGYLCGEFTGPGEFPAQRPVTRSFDVFFDLRLNKRFSKQSWGWWFDTLSHPLWRHCNHHCRDGCQISE